MDTPEEILDEIYRRAQKAYKEEKDQEAIVADLLKVYLEYEPEKSFAWYAYGDACRIIGRKESAYQALIRAFDLASPDKKGMVAVSLGMLIEDQMSPLEAKKWFRIATDMGSYGAWIFRAANCQLLGDFEEAIDCLETAIKLDVEEKDEAFLNLGLVYRAQGEYEKAKNAFLKALETTPDYREAQSALDGLNGASEALSLIDELRKTSERKME